MPTTNVSLSNLVARQLPEFIRSEYPTFVSFLEAYYEYIDKTGVDLAKVRDIDTTLDDFIQYFKQELAHNYPVSNSYDTERYLLKHVKDQYLAKGSEASYKLLFRLLYGKDVYMDYPGKQMLRVSDGKWQQDVSIFVKVNTGDAYQMIGKTVSIQTTKKISRDPVTAKAIQVDTVTATIENVIKLDGETDIFEFFLDRNFYGEIYPKDVIKYSTSFQGQVLACTTDVSVGRTGEKFRPGMVFKVSSGEGTPLWFKVLKTDSNGGLVTVDLIKFGLFYNTDFAVTLLPTSAATTRKKFSRTPVVISYELVEGVLNGIRILNGGQNYQVPPTVIIGGTGTGAQATAVLDDGVINAISVLAPGVGYTSTPNVYVGSIGSIGWEANLYVQTGTLISVNNGARYYLVKTKGALGTSVPTSTNGTEEVNGTAVLVHTQINDGGGSGAVVSARIGVDLEAGQVTEIIIEDGGSGYNPLSPPSIIIAGQDGSGALAAASVANGVVRRIVVDPNNKGKGYGTAFINIVPQIGDVGTGARAEPLLGSDYSYLYDDETSGFTENGYLNTTDYWDYNFSDGAYVGTIIRQFFIDAKDTIAENPALVNVSLGAVARYPGYFKTNDGFLDDSIFIQDSYYYQTFSYVIRIDEQLQSYASVVRTMLHPSGMALFGEYSINNTVALSIGLDSLVKSLGVTLYDDFRMDDTTVVKSSSKYISDEAVPSEGRNDANKVYPLDQLMRIVFVKSVTDSFAMTEPLFKWFFTKKNTDFVDYITDSYKLTTTLAKTDSQSLSDSSKWLLTKKFEGQQESVIMSDPLIPNLAIGLNSITDNITDTGYIEGGYLHLSPYDQGGYFSSDYNVGRLRDFSS